MRSAFDDNADFTGMTPERGLFLRDVAHRAFVSVDEHGTEAAATETARRRAWSIVGLTEQRPRASAGHESVDVMAPPDEQKPPDAVHYGLEEALTLLAALEDARDALIQAGHYPTVVQVETEIRSLSRRLGFEDS